MVTVILLLFVYNPLNSNTRNSSILPLKLINNNLNNTLMTQ